MTNINIRLDKPKKAKSYRHIKGEEAIGLIHASFETRYNYTCNRVEYRLKGSSNPFKEVRESTFWHEFLSFATPLNFKDISADRLMKLTMSEYITPWIDPLKLYFKNIGKPRLADPIAKLCSFVNLEDTSPNEAQRFERCLKKWFVGAVKTAFSGYIHKPSIVFCGPEDMGKTAFLRNLAPPSLRQDLCQTVTSFDASNKDDKISVSRYFICLVDELDNFLKSKKNRDSYKTMVSLNQVNARLPYTKAPICRKRICNFLGTSNHGGFLTETTGQSRFSIFNVKSFKHRDFDAKNDAYVEGWQNKYIDDCWAWAYQKRNEVNPKYTFEEVQENNFSNESFQYSSAEFEQLGDWLEPAEKGDERAEFMTTTQICSYLNSKQLDVRYHNVTLGKALRRRRFMRTQEGLRGFQKYGYWVVKTQEDNTWNKAS